MGILTHCCCCISLRTGTLIIGVLYLVASSVSCAGLLVAVFNLFNPRYQGTDGYQDGYIWFFGQPGLDLPSKVITLYLLALSVLQIVVDIVLIIGAAKRNAALVVPWFVLNIVMVVFNQLGLLAISVLGFYSMEGFINVVSMTPLAVGLLYLAASTYIMMVVSSFYESARKSF